MTTTVAIKALASEKRRQILQWLKDPEAHFPPQVDGDLVKDGVCGVLIAAKLGVSQPTVSEHLKLLSHAGLVRTKRIKQWTFYKRERTADQGDQEGDFGEHLKDGTIRGMLIRITALLCAILAFDAAAADRKEWEQHADCRYIERKYNDGDSFRVSCGAREMILRLYYVDAPESNMSNAARVGEQREYFAATIEGVLSTGEAATRRVRELLQRPFSVATKWAVAGGRSKELRYYGLIDVGGKRLTEILVSEGLARTKGRGCESSLRRKGDRLSREASRS